MFGNRHAPKRSLFIAEDIVKMFNHSYPIWMSWIMFLIYYAHWNINTFTHVDESFLPINKSTNCGPVTPYWDINLCRYMALIRNIYIMNQISLECPPDSKYHTVLHIKIAMVYLSMTYSSVARNYLLSFVFITSLTKGSWNSGKGEILLLNLLRQMAGYNFACTFWWNFWSPFDQLSEIPYFDLVSEKIIPKHLHTLSQLFKIGDSRIIVFTVEKSARV